MQSSRWRPAGVVVCGVLLASLFPITAANAVAGFGDVPEGAFYAAPVQWMDDEEITTGTSPGCFSPSRSVTRGEFATFLWRASGSLPGGSEPFVDVNPGDFFATAVAWMVDERITTGTSPTTFHPDRAVTRGEAATFLWRASESPSGGSEPFVDVNPGDFFATAVAWMVDERITTGTSPTTFHPNRAVTRGETATFLWRRAGEPSVDIEPGGICNVAPTTTTSTVPPSGGGRFETLAPGALLPSGEWCAGQVRSASETRSMNASYNQTRGTSANDRSPSSIYGRVDGDFTGTTDEIIQWAACKWGIDEDVARAQIAKESYWDMRVGGDLSSNQNDCHPDLRTNDGSDCPESIGLGQVRWLYHMEAFEDSNAIESSAYNVDYTYAVWRDCYDGNLGWLNTVERGATYGAGDLDGCLGVWFSGRWYTSRAVGYIADVNDYLDIRIWEQDYFLNYTG